MLMNTWPRDWEEWEQESQVECEEGRDGVDIRLSSKTASVNVLTSFTNASLNRS